MELIAFKEHAQDGRGIKRPAERETVVGPNSCKIALAHGSLIARSIHSDVLLVFYAPTVKLGMMLRLGNNPDQITFANSALGMVLTELSALGVQRQELVVYEIGGLSPRSKCLRCLRHLLATEKIAVRASDVGNNQVRSAWLSLDSGRLIVRGKAN
jgi:chemotaxis receptor (MCP) glutamine deamidase CheD